MGNILLIPAGRCTFLAVPSHANERPIFAVLYSKILLTTSTKHYLGTIEYIT